jgi:hypothetical protein
MILCIYASFFLYLAKGGILSYFNLPFSSGPFYTLLASRQNFEEFGIVKVKK